MSNRKKIDVESFSDKLNWAIRNLVPQRVRPPVAGEHVTPINSTDIESLSSLHKRLEFDAGEARFPSRTDWLADVRAGRCAPDILQMICDLYPELTIPLLRDSDFARFQATSQHLVQARDRYIDLGRYFLTERERLARFSKVFHAKKDQAPDWPLLALRDWRPPTPLQVTEQSTIDKFNPASTYPHGPALPGLNVRYGQIRRLLSPRAKPPFNGECYRLLDIDFSGAGGPIFTYGPCKYFDYYDTCEVHALQMASLERDGVDLIDVDPFDLGGHAAVPGVNTLTIFRNFKNVRNQNRDCFLLHRRSGATVQAGNTIHVAPSGQHQPSQAYYGLDADVSIWRTMVREFCEELYNVPEAHGLSTGAGDPLESHAFRRIVEPIFRSGASKSYLLGAGLDPVTAKPEILLVNIVDFDKIPIRERDQLRTQNPNWEGSFEFCSLTEAQIETQLNLDRTHDLKWLPAGKACLMAFSEHIRNLL